MQKNPKVGCIDIETAPIVAHRWQLFDPSPVGLNQIVRDWAILSFCLRTHDGKIVYVDNSAEEDAYDDYNLCVDLWHIFNDYDVLVTQNGVSFDMKKVRARFLTHGFPPPSPCRCEDTKLMARRVAKFTSNRLEWFAQTLTKHRKLLHKAYPGHSLWVACLAGDKRAWAEMRAYNIADVRATYAVYLRLLPWQSQTGSLRIVTHGVCPTCASRSIMEDGTYQAQTRQYVRYQCKKCLSWARSSAQQC